VDSFSVGYTDPWFEPGAMEGWLADRTQLGMEAAYIQERRSLYLLHRRRFTTSLQWLLSPKVSFQVGYRFERVDTAAALADISSDELAVLARYPLEATISAPYVQLARDTRDNALDPTQGSYSVARVELANQLFLTSANSSFVKLDLRQQWTWPVGPKARSGVVALGVRVGVARPTASSAQDLPLSERFFAGGSFTQRGVEPDGLGPLTAIPLRNPEPPYQPELDGNGNPLYQTTPLGGQGLALINLEYRFPLFGSKTFWAEVFVDSGQVYASLVHQGNPVAGTGPVAPAQFPPFRTSTGLGLIFKWSIPIKLEYAADIKRILGETRPPDEVATQLKGISISAGFQF
jgi:outer membrane protein assembly factor BamA